MFTKIQLWLAGAGALIGGTLLAVLYVFGLGKKQAQADSIVAGQEEKDEFQDSIRAGHDAGNAAANGGLVPVDSDPNNRANRRPGKT